jgi:hypothetical protein
MSIPLPADATLVDQVVTALVAAVRAAMPSEMQTRVFESLATPLDATQAPAIDISLRDGNTTASGGGSAISPTTHVSTTITVEVAIYTISQIQANGSVIPARQAASPLWALAHRAIVTDQTLTNMTRPRLSRSQWRNDQGNGLAGWAVHTYTMQVTQQEATLAMPPT